MSQNAVVKKDSVGKLILLGVQHVFAMFGATVLVPALTGLNPGVALLAAGIGTWIFHLITGRKVPTFLGSSFAFIAAMSRPFFNAHSTMTPTLSSVMTFFAAGAGK